MTEEPVGGPQRILDLVGGWYYDPYLYIITMDFIPSASIVFYDQHNITNNSLNY